MNSKTKSLVLEKASLVRAWAEATNRRRRWPSTEDLCGWCAIASSRLWQELSRVGVKSELHMAIDDIGCHVFVVVDDHVVDVTATQFREYRNQPILLRHQRELEGNWFHCTSDVFESADELRQHQVRTEWPDDQVAKPRSYR